MRENLLTEKSRVFEDVFFRERDQGLLEYLRLQAEEGDLRDRLQAISRIEATDVLETLIRVGITAESLTAMTLLPLVRIAWADATIQDCEREAILHGAKTEGIAIDSANYRLLEDWLLERPSPSILEAWHEYAQALSKELDENSLAEVRRSTLDRARRVAEAAGGFLGTGMGNRISENEQLVLDDLTRAFQKPKELK